MGRVSAVQEDRIKVLKRDNVTNLGKQHLVEMRVRELVPSGRTGNSESAVCVDREPAEMAKEAGHKVRT